MLLVGGGILAATVVLFSLIFGLFGADGAFATAAGLLAIMVTWDVAVERPNRQDRLAEAYAASMHSIEDIPLRTRAGATDWTDGLPAPLGAVARNAPATLAALLIVGVALGINGLLAEFTTSDRDDSVYVLMRSGAIAELKGEGDLSRSLRVTLLTILEKPERTNPSLTAKPYRKYWAAEVMVENTGAEDISAPAWKLRGLREEARPSVHPCSRRGPGGRLHPLPRRSANRMGRLRNPHLRGARVATRAATRPSSRPLRLQGALPREEVARDSEW